MQKNPPDISISILTQPKTASWAPLFPQMPFVWDLGAPRLTIQLLGCLASHSTFTIQLLQDLLQPRPDIIEFPLHVWKLLSRNPDLSIGVRLHEEHQMFVEAIHIRPERDKVRRLALQSFWARVSAGKNASGVHLIHESANFRLRIFLFDSQTCDSQLQFSFLSL